MIILIILLTHKRNPSILAQIVNYMSPNSVWTLINFTVSSSIPNCSCPNLPQHHEYAENRLISLFLTRIHELIDLSLLILHGWHYSACHTIQMLISLEISMLILYPKLEPACLLRWSLVPLPRYCQNSLHPVLQMETSHFHIPPPISTVPFQQFSALELVLSRPICFELFPSLPRSKPLQLS